MKTPVVMAMAIACTLVNSCEDPGFRSGDTRSGVAIGSTQLSVEQIRTNPITVVASSVGDFAQGHSWYLSVNSSGDASLTVDTLPERTIRRFSISGRQLEELREELINQDFFGLKDSYGEIVLDGSRKTISVTIGDMTKSVQLRYLMNFLQRGDRDVLREPVRVIRIQHIVRAWFSDPSAVDLRSYDARILKFYDGETKDAAN